MASSDDPIYQAVENMEWAPSEQIMLEDLMVKTPSFRFKAYKKKTKNLLFNTSSSTSWRRVNSREINELPYGKMNLSFHHEV